MANVITDMQIILWKDEILASMGKRDMTDVDWMNRKLWGKKKKTVPSDLGYLWIHRKF